MELLSQLFELSIVLLLVRLELPQLLVLPLQSLYLGFALIAVLLKLLFNNSILLHVLDHGLLTGFKGLKLLLV